jgi:hypothetical protein
VASFRRAARDDRARGRAGDAVYFIASGAAEVRFPGRRFPLGSGDLLGELALLPG